MQLKYLLIVLMVLNLLDMLSTDFLITNNLGAEANPLMDYAIQNGLFFFVKITFSFIILVLFLNYNKIRFLFMDVLVLLTFAVYIVVVCSNIFYCITLGGF